jgi:glycosyltransferase involved in cell wall biosynthesis
VVEAMACGTPVVTSNVSSMPEAAGGDDRAALLVDPLDTDALTDALDRALTDRGRRDEMRKAGFEQAAQFTWDRTAAATVAAYQAALEAGR